MLRATAAMPRGHLTARRVMKTAAAQPAMVSRGHFFAFLTRFPTNLASTHARTSKTPV